MPHPYNMDLSGRAELDVNGGDGISLSYDGYSDVKRDKTGVPESEDGDDMPGVEARVLS